MESPKALYLVGTIGGLVEIPVTRWALAKATTWRSNQQPRILIIHKRRQAVYYATA